MLTFQFLAWVYCYNLNETLALVHYKTQFNFGSDSFKTHLTLYFYLLFKTQKIDRTLLAGIYSIVFAAEHLEDRTSQRKLNLKYGMGT